MSTELFTRTDLLAAGKIKTSLEAAKIAAQKAHRRYYGDIVRAMPNGFRSFSMPVNDTRLLAASHDPHLNVIPIRLWDNVSKCTPLMEKALKERGDFNTIAGMTSLYKEAARQRIDHLKEEKESNQ